MGFGMQGSKIPTQKVGGMKVGQIPQFTPQQFQQFQSLFQHVSPDSYLSKLAGGDEEAFNQIEAPAMRQFSGLQGNIASRFSGMGTGARRSSGFQNTMNQASSDFAQDLQSKRQSLQQNAIRELLGLSGDLLNQRPYEKLLIEPKEKKKSFFQRLLGGALPIAGAAAGGFFGGPTGAAMGGRIGSGAAQAFY